MASRKESAQVQRLEVVELGRRRRWTTEAKLRIVEESFAGHRQASATARRYGISSALLFAWRKAYRAGGRLSDAVSGGLVPAVMVEDPVPSMVSAPSRIEIVTPNGHRVLVDAGVDEAALVRVLAVLART